MNISLHNLGRRFNQEWIFRGIDYTFYPAKKYAILGPNGSGKSTLLKVLAGQLSSSQGEISYLASTEKKISIDQIYAHISIAAPYIELIEELSLSELLDFHFKFKNLLKGVTKNQIIAFLGMEKAKNKQVKNFSSGMKQRVKLALACFSESEILLLDEPTSNFDIEGERWYHQLISEAVQENRLLIIGSNQEKEYEFCDHHLSILDFK